MALWMKVTSLATAMLFLGSHIQEAIAQARQDSAFSQILAYSVSIEALNEQQAAQLSAKAQLFKERDEILRGLADTEKDFKAVAVQGVVNQLWTMENQTALDSTMEELKRLSSVETWRSAMAGGQSIANYQRQRAAVAVSGGLQSVNAVNMRGQGLQLDAAARLVVERRQKLLLSAQDVFRRAQACIKEDQKLVDQYLELTDLANTRSRLELRAALRVLEGAEPENPGACLAKAITLLRLERADDAAKVLEELLRQPTAAMPLALAVRGELLARAGDTARAKKSANEAVRLAPDKPIVRWLRAQSLAIMKEPEAALVEWQTLLKSGQHEIAAHRGLAFTCCTLASSNARFQKLALDHAKLAHSLSGEKDWSCQIALALATATAGDLPAAEALAEAAAENAMAERKQQCLEIAAQLKAGQIPAWQF